MNVTSFIVSVIALLLSGFAVFDARSKTAAANAAAERAATAAEQSAAADARIAALAEKQVTRYSPPWRIESQQKSGYALVNDSDEAAVGVEISGDAEMIIQDDQTGADIGPRSARAFVAVPTAGSNRQLRVTWKQPSGAEQTWEHPIP